MTDNYPDDIRKYDTHPASPFYVSDVASGYEPDYGDIVDMICSTYQPELCRIIELIDSGMQSEALTELKSIIDKCNSKGKCDD
jgi:hypothetical protein